jgi:PEP-CTERM motif-containing protein
MTTQNRLRMRTAVLVTVGVLLTVRSAGATTIPVGIGAFGPGSTLTTFAAQTNGGEVNGTTVDGILFQYSLGNGQVVFDGGPGSTNNITPLNIVSIGNNSGTLMLTLPSLVDTFGYGFALLNTGPIATATTISLFNGATPVGSLSYAGVPDPTFSGGFAGIQSTLLFDHVQLTFNSAVAPAFALDNVRTFNSGATTAVPEPATLLLVATGAAALGRRRRR